MDTQEAAQQPKLNPKFEAVDDEGFIHDYVLLIDLS